MGTITDDGTVDHRARADARPSTDKVVANNGVGLDHRTVVHHRAVHDRTAAHGDVRPDSRSTAYRRRGIQTRSGEDESLARDARQRWRGNLAQDKISGAGDDRLWRANVQPVRRIDKTTYPGAAGKQLGNVCRLDADNLTERNGVDDRATEHVATRVDPVRYRLRHLFKKAVTRPVGRSERTQRPAGRRPR